MKIFNVEVCWRVISSAYIKAESIKEARTIAYNSSISKFPDPEYLDDSFIVDGIQEVIPEEGF